MAKKKRSKILKAKKRADRRYRANSGGQVDRLDMRKGGRVSKQVGGTSTSNVKWKQDTFYKWKFINEACIKNNIK